VLLDGVWLSRNKRITYLLTLLTYVPSVKTADHLKLSKFAFCDVSNRLPLCWVEIVLCVQWKTSPDVKCDVTVLFPLTRYLIHRHNNVNPPPPQNVTISKDDPIVSTSVACRLGAGLGFRLERFVSVFPKWLIMSRVDVQSLHSHSFTDSVHDGGKSQTYKAQFTS